MQSLALYLHFPWCLKKCDYCDFNSYSINEIAITHTAQRLAPIHQHHSLFTHYVNRLRQDLQQEGAQLTDRLIISIYFGGGTPSLLPPELVENLLVTIRQYFNCKAELEITLEVNPETVDLAKILAFQAAGINRFSLGIQTFHHTHLQRLGRLHHQQHTLQTLNAMKQAKVKNWNIDLIYGLPGQTVAELYSDLRQLLDHQPSHLSWYQLTVEAQTAMAARTDLIFPSIDQIAEFEQLGYHYLSTAGWQQYEIAAWSQTASYHCQHNLNYWQYGDYLGLGAGAHSKLTMLTADGLVVYRKQQPALPAEYLVPITSVELQPVAQQQLPFEFMLNHLRLAQPVSEQLFYQRTGLTFTDIAKPLTQASELGLLQQNAQQLLVTTAGKKFLNELLELFLP